MPTDFAIYPPEVNSLRMYTGPGPGPMLAAMQAWDAVADELYLAASGYQSVVSELAQAAWSGPSFEGMAAAAERHVRWLSATAAQAGHTAAAARMAAAAYEVAFASTVPPAAVSANRSLLAVLVATNVLGQNTPAIAATEALYAEMWAQDALAMYNYAGSSAAAVTVTPFSAPDHNTSPGAIAGQAAAVAGATQNVTSVVSQALSAMAAPAQGEDLVELAALIAIFLNAPGDLAAIIALAPVDALTGFVEVPPALFSSFSGLLDDDTFSAYNGEQPWPGSGPAPLEPFPATLPNAPAGSSSAPTSAALGEASLVGKLSVPSGWTVAAPEVRGVALARPLTEALPATRAPLGPAAALTGQAMMGPPPPSTEETGRPVTDARSTKTAAGSPAPDRVKASPAARPVVTGVVAAIRDIARQRRDGLLSDQEYDERKRELLESV